MEIEEMQLLRKDLELKLRNASAEVVEEFQRRTGLMINYVSINLLERRTFGEIPRSIVDSVQIRVDL